MKLGWQISFSILRSLSKGVPKNSGCPSRSARNSYFSSGFTGTSYLQPLSGWKCLVTGLLRYSTSHSLMVSGLYFFYHTALAINASSFLNPKLKSSRFSLSNPRSASFGPVTSSFRFVVTPFCPFLQVLSRLSMAAQIYLCRLRSYLNWLSTLLKASTLVLSWQSSSSEGMRALDFGSWCGRQGQALQSTATSCSIFATRSLQVSGYPSVAQSCHGSKLALRMLVTLYNLWSEWNLSIVTIIIDHVLSRIQTQISKAILDVSYFSPPASNTLLAQSRNIDLCAL